MQKKIEEWLGSVSGKGWVWYAKRMSANDAGATDSHQAGIYVPKKYFWEIFPSTQTGSNPDARFRATVYPHAEERNLRAIWYNKGTRNETRITQWNRPKRLLESEQTGAIVLMAFQMPSAGKNAEGAEIWLCSNEAEETVVEGYIGAVEPGEGILHYPDVSLYGLFSEEEKPAAPKSAEKFLIPSPWLTTFPSGQELIEKALSLLPSSAGQADVRLISRRECETELFYRVESEFVLPKIKSGFGSVDEFVNFANSVTNRRKSRAGTSFELHLSAIFREEGLHFSHGEVSEENKRPDFIFPSIESYRDSSWLPQRLRMLAAKTTCKDRWRQILNEADRIAPKHLVTLQQGVSENQFNEMNKSGVILVVPEPLHESYPKSVRPQLLTLERFIGETKLVCS